ncbi:MAG: glycosyltransferase family 2 protein [Nitrospirae bacterium]|nr:glycosyltransferase family 2 protein [Nitrospirota bacterium]
MAMRISGNPKCIELIIPESDVGIDQLPEVSIVVPALNEEITIGEFVDWCWEGLKRAGVSGEIIIVDSSSDDTPNIALAKGARVLRTPKKGLGQAYIDVIPSIRGRFIIMGDCDLTYDFREIKVFVDSFRAGNEFVMGSRFAGTIESGAMPSLHRYFGTPLTTWILNRIYHSSYSDIHCGMRGLTKDALLKINLTSKGWEYASEMVLKASRIGLKIAEVPVSFYKDREGRYSHHRRAGFWSPWLAGWINLKVMLVYSPDSFLIKPGVFSFFIGLIISLLSLGGSISIGPIGFNIYMLLLGLTATVLGYSLFQVGILARNAHGLRSGIERSILEKFTYDRGMITAGLLCTGGFALDLQFLADYIANDFVIGSLSRFAIFGLLLIILGVQTFSFTLLLELGRRLGGNPYKRG